MTQVVTVHTDFTDLNQMAQGLVGRVNETHVILPNPDGVLVGDWVQFAVTLYDGTPGFAGVGRCVTVVDNGEDRLSHQRFDVVIDSLQFDSRGQQIFEHILVLNNGAEGDAEAENVEDGYSEPEIHETGSFVDVNEVSEDFSRTQPPPSYTSDGDDEATVIGGREQIAAALSQSRAMAGGAQEALAEEEDGDIAIATLPPPAAEPAASAPRREAVAQQHAPATNGHAYPAYAPAAPKPVDANSFRFENGLPYPKVPPRPELNPSLKVNKAPRPTNA